MGAWVDVIPCQTTQYRRTSLSTRACHAPSPAPCMAATTSLRRRIVTSSVSRAAWEPLATPTRPSARFDEPDPDFASDDELEDEFDEDFDEDDEFDDEDDWEEEFDEDFDELDDE